MLQVEFNFACSNKLVKRPQRIKFLTCYTKQNEKLLQAGAGLVGGIVP